MGNTVIKDTLKYKFGFDQFREGQQAVIERLVAGDSAIAIFPTGAGKSLCYQLPALLLPNLVLVVSPLLALMQDQLEFLQSRNILAASIDSTLSREELLQTMDAVKAGDIKILMISVERFKNERFRNFIQQVPISLLVVDEAHCISEWGHNFRPDYLKLPDYKTQFNIPQVALLTATATPAVVDDMCRKFFVPREFVSTTGFSRPNLRLHVVESVQTHKSQALLGYLQDKCGAGVTQKQSTIVYVTQQQTAAEVAALCNRNGIQAAAYHAGMKNEDRVLIQQAFMQNEICCVVATIAFGMGIDKSDIRNIIHYDLPKSIENYSQEIGRAGRDGKIADCLVFASRDNIHILENFVYGDTPELSGIVVLLEQLQSAADNRWEIVLRQLSILTNIRELPLKTMLVYLEVEGVIKPLHSYFSEYSFKLLIDEHDLVDRFKGERRDFVQALLAACAVAKVWRQVDFDSLFQKGIGERSRIIAALEYFEQQGFIELRSRYMTDVYSVVNRDFILQEVAVKLRKMFESKEQSEVERIAAMVQLFESDTCISQRLAHYFADKDANQACGSCSVCEGYAVTIPAKPELPSLSGFDYAAMISPLLKSIEESVEPIDVSSDLISRFLCGLTVPLFTKIKASKLTGFGVLSDYNYKQVRQWVSVSSKLVHSSI